jgi:exosortase
MNATLEIIFRSKNRKTLLPLALAFGFLWVVLLNHLRVEWTLNPQYGYGWAVPFLCLYLAWQRIQKPAAGADSGNQKSEIGNQKSEKIISAFSFPNFSFLLFLLLALLYAPTRLVQEANPEWRLVSWALALEVVGLTWLAIYFLLGSRWLKRLAFPVGYFLVAVPWPTIIEAPLIQGLTRLDANLTVELLGWFGVPALPHGNVIEVATGEIGIDEACSGIRSFQATLMISLFLGELFRLNFARRLGLVGGGFALSFLFNVVRMFVLVWVAAHEGVTAIATWHDPTGITILLACFFGLLGLAFWMKRGVRRPEFRIPNSEFRILTAAVRPLLLTFCVWIVACEIAVEGWYRFHEERMPSAQQWSLTWPTSNPTFKEQPLADRARQILRYDESRSVAWEEDGVNWQAVFLRWDPGRTALHLAQNHTPAVCLTAAGHALTVVSEMKWIEAGGLRLPFAVYEVTDTPQPVFVFYCLWDDRTSQQGFETMLLTYGNRLAPVIQGLRNPGQRSLEIAVTGMADASAAEAAVRGALEKMVVVVKRSDDRP